MKWAVTELRPGITDDTFCVTGGRRHVPDMVVVGVRFACEGPVNGWYRVLCRGCVPEDLALVAAALQSLLKEDAFGMGVYNSEMAYALELEARAWLAEHEDGPRCST